MINARKETPSINTFENHELNENQKLNDLIINWKEISQEILLTLNKKEQISTKNKNPKSLIALGAMGSYINMALQALKATEFDQHK